uniref:Uncharacterized protein n=1 Tax=Amphimedon queenslandica TaxID=400682 RepID=A0A1X7T6V5_AMPQE
QYFWKAPTSPSNEGGLNRSSGSLWSFPCVNQTHAYLVGPML